MLFRIADDSFSCFLEFTVFDVSLALVGPWRSGRTVGASFAVYVEPIFCDCGAALLSLCGDIVIGFGWCGSVSMFPEELSSIRLLLPPLFFAGAVSSLVLCVGVMVFSGS